MKNGWLDWMQFSQGVKEEEREKDRLVCGFVRNSVKKSEKMERKMDIFG